MPITLGMTKIMAPVPPDLAGNPIYKPVIELNCFYEKNERKKERTVFENCILTRKANFPLYSYMPQVYMRDRVSLQDLLLSTFSFVTGHTPPLANVAAITAAASQLVSMARSCRKKSTTSSTLVSSSRHYIPNISTFKLQNSTSNFDFKLTLYLVLTQIITQRVISVGNFSLG